MDQRKCSELGGVGETANSIFLRGKYYFWKKRYVGQHGNNNGGIGSYISRIRVEKSVE